jgi:hypothetical protein
VSAPPAKPGSESPAAKVPSAETAPQPAHDAKPLLPEDLQADAAMFCQKRIGHWREADARALFGVPTGKRPSLDEKSVENGEILAFNDPTGKYRQVELDFDHQYGRLRTVFVYPRNLTWTECRHIWGGKVSATLANKGRRFYSYMDKKLDVLVDPSGRVISLGLY